MFDTNKVAKKIKEARIAKNMTQMNLADAMGVSYQAVSNWERGNSMPDISKLEDLCSVLDISIAQLLGMENKETVTVKKVLQDEEPLTVEELSDIAPMLPPEEMKEQARKTAGEGKQKFNLKALSGIAMFLDEDMLEELLENVQVNSLAELTGLAPFLDSDMLDKLARKAPAADYVGIIALAPFLDSETLDHLVKRCEGAPDQKLLVGLLPFLDHDTVDALAIRCAETLDASTLDALAPFMSEDGMDAVADIYIKNGKVRQLSGLYPFVGGKTMRKIAKALMAEGDLEGLKETAAFL